MRRMTNFWGFIEKIKNFIKPTSTGVKMLESIQDKNGNPRFIEGDVKPLPIDCVTFTYNKWSLSGTHLMIVLAADVKADTTIATNTTIAEIILPKYIGEKIVPLADNGFIDQQEVNYINTSSGVPSNLRLRLIKDSITGNLSITVAVQVSSTTNKTFRAQFDLLIDNE